ncbi:hypothetical protein A9Q91_02820 [Candidatus Gracilibacteria bacterium 28_42_T64]|nr:hypothetical protein A9Q91_02820 [Candidatus Gracilibacteria bacterium 28_42_T64]
MKIRSVMRKIVDYLNQKYVDHFTDQLDTCEKCSQKCDTNNAHERITLTMRRKILQLSRRYAEENIISQSVYCVECLRIETQLFFDQQDTLERSVKKIVKATQKPTVCALVA